MSQLKDIMYRFSGMSNVKPIPDFQLGAQPYAWIWIPSNRDKKEHLIYRKKEKGHCATLRK